MELLKKFLKSYENEKKALTDADDVVPAACVFVIVVVGSLIALFFVPSSLRFENLTPSDMDKLPKLHSLKHSFTYLSFAITLSLAQIPLEFLDTSNQKLKRNLKAILMLAASIFAYMGFAYAY